MNERAEQQLFDKISSLLRTHLPAAYSVVSVERKDHDGLIRVWILDPENRPFFVEERPEDMHPADRKERIVWQLIERIIDRRAPIEIVEIEQRRSPTTHWLRLLKLAALALPLARRADWLEEQRSYLFDLPTRRAKLRWVACELGGLPRFAYTVRTSLRRSPV